MQTIVHVAEGLQRGGSETMLADLLPVLGKHYRIVLITLRPDNIFGEEILKNCYAYYSLEYKGYQSFFSSIRKVKKIISEYNPVLVRSQQMLGSIIARLACPQNTPFVFSIHSNLSLQISKNLKGSILRFLEKYTVRNSDTLIGVSQIIVDDYLKNFPYKGRSVVLHNYVRDEFFTASESEKYSGGTLKLVAIGNLRGAKNYSYLVEAFKMLRYTDVQLDIYGDGTLYDQLQTEIAAAGVNIHLKGSTSRSFDVLKSYHALVMVSSFEGFGIAAAEAMAADKPLILSDIPVFKELTHGNAFFVDITAPDTFVSLITGIISDQYDLNRHVSENNKIAKQQYSKTVYVQKLLNLYETVSKRKTSDSPDINGYL